MNRPLRVFAAALMCALYSRQIYAYIDPGTGSFVLQAIVAAVVGSLFTVKLYWGRIRDYIVRRFSRSGQ
jgi:O-antigen/teichoic acid export membrane protein